MVFEVEKVIIGWTFPVDDPPVVGAEERCLSAAWSVGAVGVSLLLEFNAIDDAAVFYLIKFYFFAGGKNKFYCSNIAWKCRTYWLKSTSL